MQYARGVVRLLTLVVALSTTVVACGTDEERRPVSQFSHGLTEVTATFRARTEQIKSDGRAALAGSDAQRVLSVYESLRDATADAAERYHQLTPPSSKSAEFDAFVKNIDGQKVALDQVVRAAKAKSSGQVADALRRYAALLSDWAAALARLGGVGSPGTTG